MDIERRFQVFISSTYTDLIEERKEVMQAVLESDCLPAGMELFPAATDDQWTLIKQVIDESDYYVVVVGGRYGSTTADGLSYTEKEYDYAVKNNLPILGFVHEDIGNIESRKVDMSPEAREKLKLFREKVMTRLVKKYSTSTELGSIVSRSLNHAIRKTPQEGWVRGKHALTPERRAEIAELEAKVAQLENELAQASLHAGSEDLSLDFTYKHGEDIVYLKFNLDYSQSTSYRRYSAVANLSYSWDEIINTLGPIMIDESPENRLRGVISDSAVPKVADLEEAPSDMRDLRCRITDESWGKIIVQLRALGVIQVGTKKRTVSDKAKYWTLTAVGDKYLVDLQAEKRADAPEEDVKTFRTTEDE